MIGLPRGDPWDPPETMKNLALRANALYSWKYQVIIMCHDQILSFLETVTYNYAQIGKDVASLSELETRSRDSPTARCF